MKKDMFMLMALFLAGCGTVQTSCEITIGQSFDMATKTIIESGGTDISNTVLEFRPVSRTYRLKDNRCVTILGTPSGPIKVISISLGEAGAGYPGYPYPMVWRSQKLEAPDELFETRHKSILESGAKDISEHVGTCFEFPNEARWYLLPDNTCLRLIGAPNGATTVRAIKIGEQQIGDFFAGNNENTSVNKLKLE